MLLLTYIASCSFLRLGTLQRVHDLTMQLETICEHGHEEYLKTAHTPIAYFFGVDAREICFTRNATGTNDAEMNNIKTCL